MTHKTFTPEQQKVVDENWKVPPKECTGKCELVELHLESYCSACGWHDDNNACFGIMDADY